MKLGIRVFVGLLLFVCRTLTAHSLNDSLQENILGTKFPSKPEVPSNNYKTVPIADFSLLSGSNALPLSFMSKFAFGGYIDPGTMSQYESNLDAQNRMGFAQSMHIQLYPWIGGPLTKYTKGLVSVNLGVEAIGGVEFTRDAFRLTMQGNAPYLGVNLNAGKNELEFWRNRVLEFGFNLNESKYDNWKTELYASIGQNLSYQHVSTDGINVYTSPYADSLNFKGDFYASNKKYNFWGSGIGFMIGGRLEHAFIKTTGKNAGGNSRVIIQVKNLGMYYLSEVYTQSRNIQWMEGNQGLTPENYIQKPGFYINEVHLSNSDLRFGNWFERQKDSVVSKLNIKETNRRGYLLSPFQIMASYILSNNASKGITHFINLQYYHVTGFLPRLSYMMIGSLKLPKNIFSISKGSYSNYWTLRGGIGASYGGFDGFDLNAQISTNVGHINARAIDLTMNFNGIESYFNPSNWHGGGITVRLNYPLYLL